MKRVVRWFVIGKYGLYVGQWLLRKDAIESHCKDLGDSWKNCRRKGDRVIKATITYKL